MLQPPQGCGIFLNLTFLYLRIPRYTKTHHKIPLWLHNSYTEYTTYFSLIELVIHSTPIFLSTYLEYKKHIVGTTKYIISIMANYLQLNQLTLLLCCRWFEYPIHLVVNTFLRKCVSLSRAPYTHRIFYCFWFGRLL